MGRHRTRGRPLCLPRSLVRELFDLVWSPRCRFRIVDIVHRLYTMSGMEPHQTNASVGDSLMLTMWLNPIPPRFRTDAVAALDAGSVSGFLAKVDNECALSLVARNIAALRARGLYEHALFEAWASTRTNHRNWSLGALRNLFSIADRNRLRAAGDPLPGGGPFTIYRGVAGRGPARRVRGLSWTGSLERARWFAGRFAHLTDPAVFRLRVSDCDILAYCRDRNEEEFIVLLPSSARPLRISLGS